MKKIILLLTVCLINAASAPEETGLRIIRGTLTLKNTTSGVKMTITGGEGFKLVDLSKEGFSPQPFETYIELDEPFLMFPTVLVTPITPSGGRERTPCATARVTADQFMFNNQPTPLFNRIVFTPECAPEVRCYKNSLEGYNFMIIGK